MNDIEKALCAEFKDRAMTDAEKLVLKMAVATCCHHFLAVAEENKTLKAAINWPASKPFMKVIS